MPARLHFNRATWTLFDQGLVSLGAFLVNIKLARTLPAAEFGTYALLLGGFLGLQVISSSLLLYPMSIRLPLLQGESRARLHATTVALILSLCVPLGLFLAAALVLLGRADLALPAIAVMLAWQLQESMRRGLLAEFRHQEAIYGDAISYLGQIAALASLIVFDRLTLPAALYCIAAAFAAGSLVQALQLRLNVRRASGLAETAREFWSIGSWSLASNIISLLRIQMIPWALAVSGGPAAAASFQAVLNVVNLTNPIILGLCNVIPQTVARAREESGNVAAWEAARVYMLIGVVPALGYYALVALWPSLPLSVFYGSQSPYAALTAPVQIIVLAWSTGYFIDIICSYLHGMNRARSSLIVNVIGALTVLVLAAPLIEFYGLIGACLTLVIANLFRLTAAVYMQKRTTSNDYVAV
ncbi:polysaccharide biosynthesis C-terminal domain-containing protein [Hyphomicrobium sp.]|uniref:lipopolysaccharide biosynthesis protein n=1 Tax=Hyphomicrobium sp. TaxID=82 RepID=UPI0025BD2996|nr:polysaccharide biosynthesis C-terminal domain-containing protein [Hyphomicrobium sp.]MCC7250781.1 polysaccharide biosynthesis C-terminal domain-containing protein [Hyphomicrobium sp.]